MHIEFLKTHKVKQGDGNGPLYEAGKTYPFEGAVAETYARKYIARGLAKEVSAQAPKAGGRGRNKSAPSEPTIEPVEIRRDTVGDERKLYAVKPWPKMTRVTEEFLTSQDPAIEVADGQVKITVGNGFAVYKIGEDVGAGYRDCELVESAFEPAPEAPAV